jgi:peptidyl-prolyl isomerase D
VFGEVLSGKSIVRQVENQATESGDKPTRDVVIASCGELSTDEVLAAEMKAADPFGDKYEDFPEDEAGAPFSASRILAIASDCKDFGNKAFKAGDFEVALDKYQKGLRYLNEDPDVESEPAETLDKLRALRITLNSNSALMNIKLEAWDDVVKSASGAIDIPGIEDKDLAKALYRRGFAYVRLKDEDSALKDLGNAHKLAPDDSAVNNELDAVKKVATARRAKEKAAYKKFFD